MTSFLPISDLVLNSSLQLFTRVANIISSLVGLLFIVRTVLLLIQISPAQDYFELLSDLLLYFIAISLFPMLLKIEITTVADLAGKISFLNQDAYAQTEFQTFFEKLLSDYPVFQIIGKIGFLIIASLAQAIFSALTAMFIAASPIYIFMSTLLKFRGGLSQLLGIFISLSLWPVMWNILAQLSKIIATGITNSPIQSVTFYLVISVLQFLSPLFTYSLIKNMQAETGISKITKAISLAKGI